MNNSVLHTANKVKINVEQLFYTFCGYIYYIEIQDEQVPVKLNIHYIISVIYIIEIFLLMRYVINN